MTETQEANRALRWLVGGASLVLVVAGLKLAATLFVPLILGLFLAILSFPLLFWLRRHRVPAMVAVLLTLLANLTVLTVLALIVMAALDNLAQSVPEFQEQFQEFMAQAIPWLESHGIRASTWIATELLDPARLVGFLGSAFKGVAIAFSFALLVLLFLTFILFDAVGFQAKIQGIFGLEAEKLQRYTKIGREIQRYLEIKTAVGLASGVLVGLWVAMVGLGFPRFLGFLAFILHYIPNVGAIVAAVPAILLALLQLGVGPAFLVALGYLLIHFLLGNLLEPLLLGRRLRLSPLVVFFSLVFWGYVWGPVGMLLSVPLTMAVKIACENSRDLRWVAALME